MGGGSWDAATYASTTRSKIDSGTTFGYTTSMASAPAAARKAHEDLDPKKVAGPGSAFEGKNVRESRDNDEHPTSTPVAVWFDETGSMGRTPRVMQTKLTELFGLLLRKGYLEHPQVLVGGYGDAECDRVPLQPSQFESDNRIDEALDKIYLEGNGGGNGGESQALAWYFMAYHTATDAWDKRQKKGYAFFIGDEVSLTPTADQVKRFCDDGEPLGALDRESLVKALLDRWDAYVFVIDNSSAAWQGSIADYTKLFGKDRVIVVQDENAIAETIALLIGMKEGVIDLDDGIDDLKDVGASDGAIAQASAALAIYKNQSNVVVAEDAPADLDTADSDSDVARL